MAKSKIGLLLAAVAAYGVYKYSRLSPDQKDKIKERGRKFARHFSSMGNIPVSNEPVTIGTHF